MQELVVKTARDFSRNVLAPNAARWDKEHIHPIDEIMQLGELGLFGMLVPEEYGGTALGYETLAMAIEEIAAGDGGCSTIVSVMNSVVCGPIAAFGTEAQKVQWLVPLATGDMLGAFCLTEPQAGSDASALQTKAVKDGDDWLLSGSKQFITNGKFAKVAIVFAVTDPAAGKRGLSAFLVPSDSEGYLVASVEEKMGQRSSDTALLQFDQVRLPASAMLGNPGDGYRIALANLEGGRIGIASQAVGMARASFDAALQYAKERKSFGTEIFNHQAIQFKLAEMATRLEAARQLVLHAARLKDAGQPCLKEACMAKLFASDNAEWICSEAIQVLGGYGYLSDFPLERIYRDVRVTRIYEGTSEIQKIVIAKALGR